MYCPYCNFEDTKVLESRLLENKVRRRRECVKCSNRFTTYETAQFSLTVIKKDGRMQPFDIQKVSNSLNLALGKNPLMIDKLSRKIEQKILKRKSNSIKSSLIGKFVLQELKKHDKIAYVRFASIHKEIDDPKLLEKEINMIARW